MNAKKFQKILDRIMEDDGYYGRTLRYFLAKYYIAIKPYYDLIDKIKAEKGREFQKGDLTDEQEFEIFTIKLVHDEVTKGLAEAYYQKRSLQELRNWANNYAWKTTIYKDMPKYIEKFGNDWKRDFEDIVDGSCESMFTSEMREKLVMKVGELDA